jgi:hypothetical protein
MTMAATAPRRTAMEPPPTMAAVGPAFGAVLVELVGKAAPVLEVEGRVAVVVLLSLRVPLLCAAGVGVMRGLEVVAVLLLCKVPLPAEVLLLPPTTGLYHRVD